MSRRGGDLFDGIASFGPLCAAALRAVAGKRRTAAPAAFLADLEKQVLRLGRELRSGAWRPGRYVEIEVREPKRRLVSAAPFRDRVVHHAVHAVVAPLFERGFIHHSYANRVGRGTHRAVARYERLRDRHRHVLRGDVYRYFPAIDHEILKADVRRRVACPRTLAVVDRIIDGSNPQEPVNLYYPGDDLFTPFERRRGLPIGNLTSQLFANVYLDRFDHFVAEGLRAPYLRYVDDFALFADHPSVLEAWRGRAAGFLARRRLSLHADKTRVVPTAAPAEFLGYVLLPGRRGRPPRGRRRLPEANVRRFRNRLRGLRDRWRAGTVTRAEVERRVNAWVAHAAHADTRRLRRAIFRGGWFDPGRPAPGGLTGPVSSCVAWRFVEQQSAAPPFGQPQQEHRRKPEQQHRFSRVEHAPTPEPGRPRPPRARAGASRAGHDERAPPVCAAASRPAPVLALAGAGRRPVVRGGGGRVGDASSTPADGRRRSRSIG